MRLTANQQSALRCLPDVDRWTVKPYDQGQIQEISWGIRKGDAEFALYTAGPVVWLLHRFGRGNWADSPFAWHLVPEDRRARPWEAQELERATITVLLVEAASGILQAIRMLTFSPHFTRQLHAAIERQAEAPWDPAEFDRVLDATYARLSTAEMVRGAVAKTRGGH